MKKIYFLVLALGLFGGVEAQIINIPDMRFKDKLVTANPFMNTIAKDLNGNYIKIDVNSDMEIQQSEASAVVSLDVNNATIDGLNGINDLTGIEYFVNLTSLKCTGNRLTSLNMSSNTILNSLECDYNLLTNLDVSNNPSLTFLECNNNQLTNLNVSSNTGLTTLYCDSNQLTNLNVSSNTALGYFRCYYNQLTSLNVSSNTALVYLNCTVNPLMTLNVSNNTALKSLSCNYNQLTSLNVSNNTALTLLECGNNQLSSLNVGVNTGLVTLECVNNQLTSLDVSSNTALVNLKCNSNQLTSLDVSNSSGLYHLNCKNNQLASLYIKNGSDETSLDFSNNPNLNYVCADVGQIANVQNKISTYGYANCHVNSYCSFIPGGEHYTIQGNNKFDNNGNGCDALDLGLPNLKFSITDGTNSGNIISNSVGNYTIPVIAGTHTITPVFENPSYFNISPGSMTVTFPTQASPFTQNFCITPNGVHSDLEVTLLPLQVARPGFDAKYKLIYKNKGNTTQSGTVNFMFNDAILDFVSANPTVANQTVNNLSWDFINLLPFETREIALTLNVNSPMETPAVNSGDILNYTASIMSAAADEMPNDNTFVFHQIVVNSLDPNDKTCLEGATISPAKVGEYVHYMIRFENTGTFPAQNIVVKDMIDTSKFDVNSIVPMKGSHAFVTNITSGNKVEFIFENINLPFDDANNDGYVAFKIKTKPTLVSGNTFSNTASIYFDYNFPIVTNTATTTIAALSRQDFEFSNYFKLYPNPVHDVLNIAAKETIQISSVNIYNTLGQLVLVIPNAKEIKSVDVSNLTPGNYFIKINSDKGVSNTKFIKN